MALSASTDRPVVLIANNDGSTRAWIESIVTSAGLHAVSASSATESWPLTSQVKRDAWSSIFGCRVKVGWGFRKHLLGEICLSRWF